MQEVGESLWFTVTLEKPLGFSLTDGPKGPGEGVGIKEIGGGSSMALLEKAVAKGPGSKYVGYVQEGDELQEVNGLDIEGSQDKAIAEIMAAEGPITLTFSRRKKGSILVCFPGGKIVTAPRQANLKQVAEKAGYDSGCTCKNGRCGKCWHQDPVTGELYMLPINCPGIVPSIWRKREEDRRGQEADFEAWIPLRLEPCPKRFEKFMANGATGDP
jgi:ferredoxin